MGAAGVTTRTSGRACNTIGAAGALAPPAGVAATDGRAGTGTIVSAAVGAAGEIVATVSSVLLGVDSARTCAIPIVATRPNMVDAPTPSETIRAPAAG